MRLTRYLAAAATCAIVASPLFIYNGWQGVWSRTYQQTAMDQSGWDWRIAWMNARVWWWNDSTRDYAAGPFLDPVTGVLVLAGLAYATIRLRDRRTQVVLLWLLGLFSVTGLLEPHAYPGINRILILVPPMAFLAASVLATAPRLATPVVVLAILANLVQWFWYVPTHMQVSGEARAYERTQSLECRSRPQRSVVLNAKHEHLLAWQAAGGDMPLFADTVPMYWNGCVVVANPPGDE